MEDQSAHRREAYSRMSSLGKRFFNLIEFDDEEQFILEIRKHSFGLFLIQLGGFFVTMILTLIPLIISISLDSVLTAESGNNTAIKSILIFTSLILAISSFVATMIAVVIYRNNVIYITDEKIAQVIYTSLFNRKLSQLSIGDVQDVTVSQNGIFPRLLNYGTLVIETAGEQQNYTFNYVPRPYESSRHIIQAHEQNVHRFGN